MNVKKFIAPTSREALRKVREALGAEAIILSNRSIDQGVEILAMASEDIAALAAPVIEREAVPRVELPLQTTTLALTTPTNLAPAAIFSDANAETAAVIRRRVNISNIVGNTGQSANEDRTEINQATGLAEALETARAQALAEASRVASHASEALDMVAMMNEIKSMRGLLETQLAELSWGNLQKREPARSEILQELLMTGFSPAMARYLIEKLPSGHNKQQGLNWVRTILTRNLVTMESDDEIVEQGGVFALVGPTGVGKTTTTAKLAARVVMRHGPGKLALITTDGYRIGGHEQLRIYGKILGVIVHSVKDEADLRIVLNELKGKHTVLIDTAGVGQRDQMVTEQTNMLSGLDIPIKRLLCLAATSTGETLNEVVRAYQGNNQGKSEGMGEGSDGIHGCIITKLDEAVTIGSVLDTVVRHKLNLYYIANGQRVPEDLHQANRDYLIDKAFKLKRDSASFALTEDELPLVMAHVNSHVTSSRSESASHGFNRTYAASNNAGGQIE